MNKRIVSIAIFSLVLCGCSSLRLSKEAKKIKQFKGLVTQDCKYLGKGYGQSTGRSNNVAAAEKNGLNAAATAGANWVKLGASSSSANSSIVYIHSYRCESERMSLKQKCDLADTEACIEWHNKAVKAVANYEAGYSIKKACRFGSKMACDGIEKFKTKINLLSEQCDKGNGQSCKEAASNHHTLYVDDEAVLVYLEKGCKVNHRESCNLLEKQEKWVKTADERKQKMIENNEKQMRETDNRLNTQEQRYHQERVLNVQRQQNAARNYLMLNQMMNMNKPQREPAKQKINCRSKPRYDVYGKFLGYDSTCK